MSFVIFSIYYLVILFGMCQYNASRLPYDSEGEGEVMGAGVEGYCNILLVCIFINRTSEPSDR